MDLALTPGQAAIRAAARDFAEAELGGKLAPYDASHTRAEAADGGWRLNGSKAFITNASVGDVAVVMARTEPEQKTKGISAFIVPKGTPGFSTGTPYRKLGLHASDTAELIFEDARLPT